MVKKMTFACCVLRNRLNCLNIYWRLVYGVESFRVVSDLSAGLYYCYYTN